MKQSQLPSSSIFNGPFLSQHTHKSLFPPGQVVKSYKTSPESPLSLCSPVWTQSTAPGGHLRSSATEVKNAPPPPEPPNYRLGPQLARTAPVSPRTHSLSHCTKVPSLGPSSTFTTVTATASVLVALHPSLPGSCHGYTHEGFESDCPEEPDLPDRLELQDTARRH